MAIGDDFTIDYVNKRVYHSAGTTVYTVNELYSWLMDQFDEQGAMDDQIPITAQTPTAYTMVNGWYMDIGEGSKAYHFLKGGAIKTDGYLNEIQVLVLDNYTSCVAGDIGKTVTDDTVDIGELLSYDNTAQKWWIRTGSGTAIADNSVMAITTGTGAGNANGASVDGEDLYANVYTLGTIEATGLIYITQAGTKIDPDWWSADGHIDVLVQVKEAGVEIDDGKITVYLRVFSDLYDFYEIDLTDGGRNAVPLATFDDPDNQTAIATVMNYMASVKVMFANGELGYDGKTLNDPIKHMVLHDKVSNATAFLLDTGGGAAATGTFELGDVEGTFGDNNALEICSELPFDAQTGQFTVGLTVSGATASGVIRRIIQDPQSQGTVGILYITGVTGTFVDNETITDTSTGSAAANIPSGITTNTFDALVNLAITIDEDIDKDLDNGNGAQPYDIVIDLGGETVAHMYEYVKALARRTSTIQMYTCNGTSITKVEGEQYQRAEIAFALKKASPFGTFAGGKFFGARGVWIEDMASADSENYSLCDALGATQTPPTQSTIKVVAMVATNDRLLVCESTGTGSVLVKKDQYTMTTQSASVDYVQVSGAIADDAPSSGIVRVVRDYGTSTESEDIYTYTSIDRSGADDKFMISGVTSNAYDSADRAYNPWLDKNADGSGEAEVTVKYAADKYIVTIVRYKGYIPFDVAGQLVQAGVTITAIRTTDGIYTP